MRRLKILLRLVKGLYDILAGYLLGWVLLLALLAGGFHLLLLLGLRPAGFEDPDAFWTWLGWRFHVNTVGLRLALFGTLHATFLWLLAPRLRRLQARLERGVDRVGAALRRRARRRGQQRRGAGLLFTTVVTLLLVPFVLQPTLVALRWDGRAWAARAANLADGTATAALVESVVGLYRKVYSKPVPARGISESDYAVHEGRPLEEETPALPHVPKPVGKIPLLDRWDGSIRAAVGGDARRFAQVKAFMYVESGGRQFAVSRTGCAGLMQFCVRTARSGDFRRIFGLGQVYPCRCPGSCGVPGWAQRALETGATERLDEARAAFPCDLTDARFDGEKSIRAGTLFIDRLARRSAGNLYLMYIGYNSGPAVVDRLLAVLPNPGKASLEEIAPHLPGALTPYFGSTAAARAAALMRAHLPRLRRAHDTFLRKP